MAQIGIADFLDKVGKLSKTSDKIAALKANDSLVLRIILQGAYDPNVEWLVPEGSPSYKPNELVDQEHILIHDCNKLKYFIKGFGDNLKPVKRELMFIQFLERVSPADAKMLINVKDKKQFPGITVANVREALPDLFPNSNVQDENHKIVDVRHDTLPLEELLPTPNTQLEEVLIPMGSDVIPEASSQVVTVTKTVTKKKA